MARRMGDACLSTPDQSLSLPCAAVRRAGGPEDSLCVECASGPYATRPGLAAGVQALARGDTRVGWRWDRLGRFLLHMVRLMAELHANLGRPFSQTCHRSRATFARYVTLAGCAPDTRWQDDEP